MALTLLTDTYVLPDDPYFQTVADWVEADSAEQEAALVAATRYIDSNFLFLGVSLSADQPLIWPRTEFSYYDPHKALWVAVDRGTVPQRLQVATAELAVHYLRYPQAAGKYEAEFDSITLGPLSISNANPELDARPVPRLPARVASLLSPLLRTASTTNAWWRAN